jgi:hypothetical protein
MLPLPPAPPIEFPNLLMSLAPLDLLKFCDAVFERRDPIFMSAMPVLANMVADTAALLTNLAWCAFTYRMAALLKVIQHLFPISLVVPRGSHC